MDFNRIGRYFRVAYYTFFTVALGGFLTTCVLVLLAKKTMGLADVLESVFFFPGSLWFRYFCFMIILGIAGIILDRAQFLKYIYFSIGFGAMAITPFIYLFFFMFLNLGGLY